MPATVGGEGGSPSPPLSEELCYLTVLYASCRVELRQPDHRHALFFRSHSMILWQVLDLLVEMYPIGVYFMGHRGSKGRDADDSRPRKMGCRGLSGPRQPRRTGGHHLGGLSLAAINGPAPAAEG